MAALFCQINPIFKKIQEAFFNKSAGFVRNGSKKSGSGHVGKADHGRPSRFGFKKHHNSFATSGSILYHQHRLSFLPGLNVGIGKVAKLYAKVPGKVLVTSEKTNFKADQYIVSASFPNFIPPYRKYINVIPEPLHKRFKLIDKI